MSFSIFINTTEDFKDCWFPFFNLFKSYWPEYKGKIYLNTEKSNFEFNGLNIISIKNNGLGQKWSFCLKKGLETIEEEDILYLQEDYFFKDKVDHESIQRFYKLFALNNFDCLHLTDQNYSGPFKKDTGFEDFWELLPGSKFRISTQAAFWRKKVLIDLLRDWETGWQFEKYSTLRANRLQLKLMSLRQDKYGSNKQDIIPYVLTGIINNRWKKEVITLFLNNGISIDFTKRGFFENQKQYNLIYRIRQRLKKVPMEIKSRFNLFNK